MIEYTYHIALAVIIAIILMLIYGFIRIHREDKSYQDRLIALRGKKLIPNHPEAPHGEWLKEEMANNSNIKILEELGRSSNKIEREKR